MTKAIASAWLTTLMLTACGGEQSSSGSTAATAARKVWTDKCAVCHGEDGKGQGPGAMALNPKPRSFTDPKWQTYTADDRIT
nr:c-type cytochrome [Deltaproteobacteria bacterium]